MNEVNNTGLVRHIYLSPYIIHLEAPAGGFLR
jgi:hypothetical protein